jgi:hypothetical protein
MRKFNKIFGIGLSRTGTTSLATALECLGIPTIHWPTNMLDICKFRGASDITVACRFRELDQIFPDSLFVYTEREAAAWMQSVTAHYSKTKHPAWWLPHGAEQFALEAEIRLYGKIWPTAEGFAGSYQRHHASVLKYFRGREDRLLRFNISAAAGWGELCGFLGAPTPKLPFPHQNKMGGKT